MDTSKQYIETCQKAEEIQLKFNYDDGDYFIDADGTEWNIGGLQLDSDGNLWDSVIADNATIIKPVVWLPRQDQLQEMIIVDKLPIFGVNKGKENAVLGIVTKNIIDKFKDWLDIRVKADHLFCYNYNSMEQFWLMFVMKEKYNKTWNKGEWIDA